MEFKWKELVPFGRGVNSDILIFLLDPNLPVFSENRIHSAIQCVILNFPCVFHFFFLFSRESLTSLFSHAHLAKDRNESGDTSYIEPLIDVAEILIGFTGGGGSRAIARFVLSTAKGKSDAIARGAGPN